MEEVVDHILLVEDANLDIRELLLEVERFEILGNLLTNQEHLGVAMFDESEHHLGRELIEQRNGNGAISESSKQADAPFGTVASTKCHTETRLQSSCLPCQMITCDTSGYITVIIVLSLII